MRNSFLASSRFFLVALIIAASCGGTKSTVPDREASENIEEKSPPTPLFLPPDHYDAFADAWKKVEAAEKAGKPRSALEAVTTILSEARATRNIPQMVKALIQRTKFSAQLGEKPWPVLIKEIETEIGSSSFPEKNLLHSVVADFYWHYFQMNRWRFYERTEGTAEGDDIASWSLQKLMATITAHHHAALEHADALCRIPIALFDEVFTKGTRSRALRPTLYDLVAHRAADFFMNEEPALTESERPFEMNDTAYLLPAERFAVTPLPRAEGVHLARHALAILQELTRFHLRDREPDALVEVEIKRLLFVRSRHTAENRDELLDKSLELLEQQYAAYPVAARITYERARLLYEKALRWRDGMPEAERWGMKQALDRCTTVSLRWPESEGAALCTALSAQITYKELQIQAEPMVTPERPSFIFVRYRNVGKVYFRTVKLSPDRADTLTARYYYGNDYAPEKIASELAALPPRHSWEVTLPDDGDLREHRVEVAIPPLERGDFAILAATAPDFSLTGNHLEWVVINATPLAFQHRIDGGALEIFVADRESGRPREQAKVVIAGYRYDYTTGAYREEPVASGKTDRNGMVRLTIPPNAKRSAGFSAHITVGNDRLKSFFWGHPDSSSPRPYTRTYFFTDRTIYRPGQTIYFKGITVTYDATGMPKIVTEQNDSIEFFDTNNQKVATLSVTTNDYGSFHGSFTAPSGALNGRMTIRNKTGSVGIQIEEYKRPLFEATLDAPRGSYRLGDTVVITGKANSYAGAPLTEAKVHWFVEREVRFPYFCGWWGHRWFYDFWNGKKAMIAHGETMTGPDGRFSLSFPARPDTQIAKEHQPLFSYRVHAEVTDLNGETHAAERFVQAAYSAINLTIGGAMQEFVGKPLTIEIAATNMNNEPQPTTGTVTISRLKDRDRLLRRRLFPARPDRFILSRDEFVKQFPHDPYGDEETAPREKEKEYLRRSFDTGAEKSISVTTSDWPIGEYLIEVTAQDSFGQPVTTQALITLRDHVEGPFMRPIYEDIALDKEKYEPGENAALIVASGADAVSMVLDIVRSTGEERLFVTLDRSRKIISIPITERDRGNIAVRYLFIKHGRSFPGERTVVVPWSNKQLKYEFLSFRSTLQPGEKEEWRIKITGPQGELVAAELAAALYDGALDAFVPHGWSLSLFPTRYRFSPWLHNDSQQTRFAQPIEREWNTVVSWPVLTSDKINYFGMQLGIYGDLYWRDASGSGGVVAGAVMGRAAAVAREEMALAEMAADQRPPTTTVITKARRVPVKSAAAGGLADYEFDDMDISGALSRPAPPVQIRKNLQETAFFYPHLMTDEKGEVVVSFTVPEALTTWKMLGIAHTKELATALLKNELQTQKELMVAPNVPRFLRGGDRIVLSAKISNLTDTAQTGTAELTLLDARTMSDIGADFSLTPKAASFNAPAKGNTVVTWQITVPQRTDPVVWRIVARAGNMGDGEENTVPLLSNRMLVTETLPLPVNGKETKNFTLQKLKDPVSPSLTHHRLTLEFTANPAWYAVQAFPSLIESPYECVEQVFSRYYANSLAAHIVRKHPSIEKVFAQWKGTAALDSNVMKNEELKSALLRETPWVLDAQDEAASKRRIALLFDLNRMGNELKNALDKLRRLQVSSGGWPWFPGLPEDRYITQHIAAGLGKLKKLGVAIGPDGERMAHAAIAYLDRQMDHDYRELLRAKADMTKKHISYLERHYLYGRSFFADIPVTDGHTASFDYWKKQAATYWLEETPYMTALTATALNRFGDGATAARMIASLKERAITSDELGMYWKENMGGYYWFQFPIEAQAALIEAFEEVGKDRESADKMKTWLIKMKQVQNWRTTKATADAVYALLSGGSDWFAGTKLATVTVGGKKAGPTEGEPTPEAGTGYFKTSWPGAQVTPAMAQVTVQNPNPGPAWGALYWQYFEDLDKITAAQSPLSIERQILREKRADSGAILEPITDQTPLTIGDRIVVRLILKVDRDMEYLHLKDGRPTGTEPVEVLSGNDYRDGLWLYRVTTDTATNFFIHRAVKGTYVLEYRLTVTLAGTYSAGIATVQCLYAPEFAAHSAGMKLTAQ